MDRQYFNARIALADGRSIDRQLGEEGLDLPLGPGDRVVSVALRLPVYGLEGESAPLTHASVISRRSGASPVPRSLAR